MNTEGIKEKFCDFEPMEILKEELPVVKKIIEDECWYKGERVHRPVQPAEVETEVDKIVLKDGEKLRIDAVEKIKKKKCIHNCDKCKYHKKEVVG